MVQPDVCVVCDPAKLHKQGCKGAPDLVVEVLSPGNSKREMKDKFEAYQTAGVREYWIISPQGRTVIVYVLDENGNYNGLPPWTDEETITSAIFPDLSIDLTKVFPKP